MSNNEDKSFENEDELKDTSQEQALNEEAINNEAEEISEKGEQSLEEKYNELNDRFLRLYADFDNYRKRTNKEKIDIISNANEKLLLDLVPTIDDFERAIENNKNSDDIASIKEGFNLIYNKFKSALEAKGLKQMQSKGEVFNSELHEAIANLPSDNKMKGKVIEDIEKGYLLNDKVIRYAKVIVGQ